MEIGIDAESRPITFDESSSSFAIGGIDTTVDRVVAYDRGGNVRWATPEIQAWVYDFENGRRRHVAGAQAAQAKLQADEVSRRHQVQAWAQVTASGYDPSAILRFGSTVEGLATFWLIGMTLLSASAGFLIGLVVSASTGTSLYLLATPLLGGGIGFALALLLTMAVRAVSNMMRALVQIEMNTRSGRRPFSD